MQLSVSWKEYPWSSGETKQILKLPKVNKSEIFVFNGHLLKKSTHTQSGLGLREVTVSIDSYSENLQADWVLPKFKYLIR